MPRFVRAALELFAIVAGTSFVAIAALGAVRGWLPTEALRASSDEVGNYLQTVGTIYAVLLAFVVQSVWTQFNEARSLVEREATQIVDLSRIVDALRPEIKGPLHVVLARYLDGVITREWKAMATGDEQVLTAVGAELDAVWSGLHGFEPVGQCETNLHAEALNRFSDLSDARTNRLTAARIRMPFGLRLLLYVGAVVLTASTFLLAVDRFEIHAIITGAIAGAVSHILYLVEDLDDAFSGLWRVSSASFERARLRLGPTVQTTSPSPLETSSPRC